jgi:hypothetical protein
MTDPETQAEHGGMLLRRKLIVLVAVKFSVFLLVGLYLAYRYA